MKSIRPVLLAFALVLSEAVAAIPAEGHKIMISAANSYAVDVGREIARRGGNVVDVAVAVGLTLSVTAPYYAALGGGGFALIKMDRDVDALDFRETAPAAAGKDYYLKKDKQASRVGGTAVGVPGFAAGLWALHQKYGKLKWAELFKTPLRLAREGFAVSGEWADRTKRQHDRFTPDGRRVFFTHGGDTALKPGETFKQPRLVKALIALRDRKAKGFYSGPVAKDIVAAVRAAGGEMTGKDLANYKVRWLKPITTSYAGDKVYLMPPPSSGGVVILSALHMMEKLGLKKKAALSAEEFHLIGEVESRAFRGRALLGDPDFSKNPVSFLTSGSYLDELTKSISPNKVVALAPLKPGDLHEGSETTHYTIMDSDGHAVALTVTLNGIYGSGVVSPGFGIALNDEMDDFTTHPGEPNMFGLIQGDANDVAAGKRPLSSMSPTLVEHDGKVVLALGAPGGPRIITGVLQVLYRVVGRGQDLDLAVQAPRVHHQFLPNILYVDRERFSPEVLDTLKNYGHKVEESGMGKVYAVRLRPDAILEGAFDSRGEGAAGGY